LRERRKIFSEDFFFPGKTSGINDGFNKKIFYHENGGIYGFLIPKMDLHPNPFLPPFLAFSHTFYRKPFL
jgi:hypothetical protein